MSIEAMKQALDALEHEANIGNDNAYQRERDALRTAIEQAEKQEPSYYGLTDDHLWMSVSKKQYDSLKPAFRMACYTNPPAAQRQPLTEDQIDDIWNRYCDEMGEASINDAYDIARAIEAAHGIGEKT